MIIIEIIKIDYIFGRDIWIYCLWLVCRMFYMTSNYKSGKMCVYLCVFISIISRTGHCTKMKPNCSGPNEV